MKEANNLQSFATLIHKMIHPECKENCVKIAYLQFCKPSLADVIKEFAKEGATKIIIHPFFLGYGVHVTKDIPSEIERGKELYPNVEFIYTEPLGVHEKLAEIVWERIQSAAGMNPQAIEKRSFEIISEGINLDDKPAEQISIIKRVIHATADFEFAHSLIFHPQAIKNALIAIKEGKDILVDVEMVKVGILSNHLKRWGGKVLCYINDPEVEELSEKSGKTKAELAIEKSFRENSNIGILAIGNSPTALLKGIELVNKLEEEKKKNMVIIGLPVGFVKALESKIFLSSQPFPFITNLSRKGGSPATVAVINALIKICSEEVLYEN